MPKGYTSRQQIENYMLVTIDPTFYAQVTSWIEEVEEYIDKETGRNFIADATATAKVYDGDGTRKLLIDDCVQVTEITIDGGTALVAGTDYVLYPANRLPKTRIVSLMQWFARGHQNIRVKAKWGYRATVPADITHAATILVAGIIGFAWSMGGEVQSETIGRYSVTYATEQGESDFENAKKILAGYEKITL